MVFSDRADAGRRLGERLWSLRSEPAVVLGLARGGVPVAFEVARALAAPLDVIVVRKLGVPFQPELGMGAIGEGGVRVINEEVVRAAGVSAEELAATEARELLALERRVRRLRGERPPLALATRTAVIVDDGIATGSTARAACRVARVRGAARVVLAVPAAPRGWEERVAEDADELVALETPEYFFAIGEMYDDFSQTSDEQVIECLERAGRVPRGAIVADPPPVLSRDEDVSVDAGEVRLAGRLRVPARAVGVVIFVHGSGSSRHSPRNRDVAAVLNDAGLATLLFDLLTLDEELDRRNVFDIELLAHRLSQVTRWVRRQPGLARLPLGYFGASTGAGAALVAAAEPAAEVAAVVSRGGRPDLASPHLASVQAPTLLLVGSEDVAVLGLNRAAQAELTCRNQLVVVPGATHLFEEAGTLQIAARAARDWFVEHFVAVANPPR